MRGRRIAGLALVATLGLSTVAGASVARSAHPPYPLGHAKSCRPHYVKRTAVHKVHGKPERYVECVYVAPKPTLVPTETTVSSDMEIITQPATITVIPIVVSTGNLGRPAPGTVAITMVDTATGKTVGSWTNGT